MGGRGSGSVDAVLLRVDGTKVKKDGTEESSNFFDVLDLPVGDYSKIEMTPEQAIKLRNLAIRMKFGTSAMMPLKCLGGSKCPIKLCPFTKEQWPIGQPCPLETRFVQVKTKSYVEDLGIDFDSPTEMSLINRLVELDLMDFRANAGLSSDDDAQTLLQRIVSSSGEFTNEMLAVHPLVEIKDKHHRQRMQILESLVATRKERYKKAASLKKNDDEDAAHHLAKMKRAYEQMQQGNLKELNLLIKADVHGSIEALVDSLTKLSNEEVNVNVVHSATGTIAESDISLAKVSNAIVIGFNIRPTPKVQALANEEQVDMRFYNVIYDVIKDVKDALVGLMESTFEERVLGSAEVREVFQIPKVGAIAGCYVTDGKIERGQLLRLVRDGVVFYEGKNSSLRRFKDDVKEVQAGYECGIGIENYNDIKVGDVLECYYLAEIKPEIE